MGQSVELMDQITVNPYQCGARPCVGGMRIRVIDVVDLLAVGLSAEQVVEELPDLELRAMGWRGKRAAALGRRASVTNAAPSFVRPALLRSFSAMLFEASRTAWKQSSASNSFLQLATTSG